MAVDIFGPGSWEERGGEVVRRLMRDLKLTPEQAAGLTGNLGFESAGFKALQERKPLIAGSAGGWGIAQWTGPRRRAFSEWAASRKLDPSSDAANYGFLIAELKNGEATFLSRLRDAANLYEATRLTHVAYERPADQSEAATEKRLEWAKRALAGAQATPPEPAGNEVDAPEVDPDLLADLIRAMQRVVGADPDGRMGPNTYQDVLAAQQRKR